MKIRPFLSVLIAALLVIGCLASYAPAVAADAAITVGSASGAPGDTVKLAVSVSNNPGIMGARLKVRYDSDLELTAVSNGAVMTDFVFGSDLRANPYVVTWDHSDRLSNMTGNGTLVTLTFRIKQSASAGKKQVSVSAGATDIFNKDLRNVSFKMTSGAVTVTGSAAETCRIIDVGASLGESISLNFYADISETRYTAAQISDMVMRFTVNGKTFDAAGDRVSDGTYMFTFSGITPQMMNDEIEARLYLSGEPLTDAKVTSFRQYLLRLKERYTDSSTQDLCNDLLIYGGAAQAYIGYRTDNSAAAGIEGRQFASPSRDYAPDTSGNPGSSSRYRVISAALYYDSRNAVRFKLSLPDTSGVSVKINGRDADLTFVSEGVYSVETDSLNPADLLRPYAVTVEAGGSEKASVTYYGVGSAALSFGGLNTKYGALVRALFNYAESAAAYQAEHGM